MSFIFLKADLITEANDLYKFIQTNPDAGQQAQAWRDLWRRYRGAAISVLLADADRSTFFNHLKQSARARIHYLQQIAQGNLPINHITCASVLEPYFDALIAGDDALTAEISRLSPRQWLESDEFEDDFCYAQFLFSYIYNNFRVEETSLELLERFETALEGGESARLDMCKALCNANEDEFNGCLQALHMEWLEFYQEKNSRLPWKDWMFLTEKALFMEGLALLSIADRLGFHTEREYSHMPGIARLGITNTIG
ncbi:MAG: Imm49 family immunity protein [Gammaproteobacteria bacterium]|nr:Imm49 family immunity protein [Gammaproteobacteria bacterium]